MGCNKYVETGVQCGSCYRWYHYKCEGTTEKEIKKLYPQETHYICKKDQNSESIIKWKNQYELKQREAETVKRINERIMKEREEIKRQYDQLKEQYQKDKQKEQQKENEITKISQEKKILEAVVKTLGNCDRIKINHASDKDQQIKDLKIQLQKEKDTGKILVKDNVEMKSQISTQEIILKQKEQEEKERKNELNDIKKEIDKIKRENQQQTKNSNIEKENNIKTIKKLQEEKDTLEKQMTDLKTLNLNLETNLHRQQNKETQQTEQLAISRQPTGRTDQERERKENKEQKMKEINKKICYACESDNHEIKECDSGKNIFIIDRASRQINKEELKYRLEEYGKIECIKIRQDKYGRPGNVGMVCFETKNEANAAIQDLNERTRYIAKEYEHKKQRINIDNQDKIRADTAKEKERKSNLLNTVTTEHIAQTTQSTNRSEQNKEQRVNNIITTRMSKVRTTGCREQERVITDQLCYGCGSKEHKIQKCNKKNNIFVTNNERRKMKDEEMRGIMEEYGEVKSLKLRYHPNNTRNEVMICFSTEEEAQLAITEINTYEGWRAELYKPIRKSRELETETKKPRNSNKEHEQRKNNESSTKQVELSYLKEEIKYIKRTLDILLKRQ